MLMIRLARFGAKKKPTYRVVVIDKERARDGRALDHHAFQRVIDRCAAAGINPGFALGRVYEEHPTGLLVAITEQRSREHIDRLADVLAEAVAAEQTERANSEGVAA